MRIAYIQDQEVYRYKDDFYHDKSGMFFERYLAGLRKEDQLIVLCGIVEVNDEKLIAKCKNVTNDRIQFKPVPNFRKISNVLEIKKRVDEAVSELDFCYLRCGIASSFAAMSCMRYKVPYMSIINEDIFKNTLVHPKIIVKLSSFPLWILSKRAVKKADFACYVTSEYLQKQYPNPNKNIGCSDVEALELSDEVLTNRLNKIKSMDENKVTIGTAGSVDAFLKAHDLVIKALSNLKGGTSVEYTFEIVGGGNPKRILDMAEELGVISQVKFIGQLSHDDVIKWMDRIDIYIHPSRSEGLPRTVLEAISRATPCICSDVGGIPELVQDKFLFKSKMKYPERRIAELLSKMNKDEMLKQSIINFENAQKYAPDLLKQRRDVFFEGAIEYARKGK